MDILLYAVPTYYSSVRFRSQHNNSGYGRKFSTEFLIRFLLNFIMSSGSAALDYFHKNSERNISVVIQLLTSSSAFKWFRSAI